MIFFPLLRLVFIDVYRKLDAKIENLRTITMHTQRLLNGPGSKLGLQLISMVGLEFPTKGSSLLSIPMTPLSSHEFSFFPLKVALPLDGTSFLSLFYSLFSSHNFQPILFIHFRYL